MPPRIIMRELRRALLRAVGIPVALFVLLQGAVAWHARLSGNAAGADEADWAVNVMYLSLLGVGYLAGWLAPARRCWHSCAAGALSAVAVVVMFPHLLAAAQSRAIFICLGGALALLGALFAAIDRKHRRRL